MIAFEKWESKLIAVGWEHLKNIFLKKISWLCSELIPVEVSGAAETAVRHFRPSPASGRQCNIRLSWWLKKSSRRCFLSPSKHLSCKILRDRFHYVNFQNTSGKLLSLILLRRRARKDSQGHGVQFPAVADAKLYNPYTKLMNACVWNGAWGNYRHTFY